MNASKYVGMDVHKAMTVVAVLNADGKLVQESVLETRTETIRDFIRGLSGRVAVTFEEGTQADWLHDLITPLVAELVVCNARETKTRTRSKGDKADARRLAAMLRNGDLKGVYHGHRGTRTLKYLVGTYNQLVEDCTRVQSRIKAIYRGRGIACSGKTVYGRKYREAWLAKLDEEGARVRAALLMEEFDALVALRKQAKGRMQLESRRHKADRLLQTAPGIGAVRAAQLIAILDTPHRFRNKRAFWSYAGLAVVTWGTAEYEVESGAVRRRKGAVMTRGLNRNGNRRLKDLLKGAASTAIRREPVQEYYQGLVARGLKPEVARVHVARKLGAVMLAMWKGEEEFSKERFLNQTS